MLSYQISDYYRFIKSQLDILQNDEVLNSICTFASEIEHKIYFYLNESILNSRAIEQIGSEYRYLTSSNINYPNKFKQTVELFKQKFDVLDGYMRVQKVKQDILQYSKKNGIPFTAQSEIDTVTNSLEKVFQLYQIYIQSGSMKNAQLLSDACIEYHNALNACITSCKVYLELDKGGVDTCSKEVIEKALELRLLDTKYSFKEFTLILELVNDIYENIGNVIYKEGNSYESLEIIKIESGSLLSKLLGDKNIIEAVGLFLTKSINLIFNKYTREGQLYRHKELMDELKNEVELGEKLKSLGYDINDSTEAIEISYAHITKGLLQIVSSSAKIKVNEYEYSIEDEMRKNEYLSATRVNMIENSETVLNKQ